MEEQSELLRVLRPAVEVEPRAGFYARVLERVEAQRPASIWSLFLVPAFGRRLATASLTLAVLLGVYLVSTEPGGSTPSPIVSSMVSTTTQLPGEDGPGVTLGQGQEQDRNAVFVDLASYREQ